MRIVTFISSILLIFWLLFLVALAHQHLGLNEGTETRDFILWGIFALIHVFCALEPLISWIGRRPIKARQMAVMQLAASGVLLVWLMLAGGIQLIGLVRGGWWYLILIVPLQAFLVYKWLPPISAARRG